MAGGGGGGALLDNFEWYISRRGTEVIYIEEL